MIRNYIILLYFLLTIPVLSQEAVSKKPSLTQPITKGGKNFAPTTWNEIIATTEIPINRSGGAASLLGNYICDAMLSQTKADFAFISSGELYSDLYQGDITALDMYRVIPFDRRVVVLEMSGDTLKQMIENTLGGLYKGLAIGGGKVEYNPTRPVQNRLTYVQIGEYPLYPKRVYRVVTIDYHASGFAGFEILSGIDANHTFPTGILLRDSLTEYARQNSPLTSKNLNPDNRWKKK